MRHCFYTITATPPTDHYHHRYIHICIVSALIHRNTNSFEFFVGCEQLIHNSFASYHDCDDDLRYVRELVKLFIFAVHVTEIYKAKRKHIKFNLYLYGLYEMSTRIEGVETFAEI